MKGTRSALWTGFVAVVTYELRMQLRQPMAALLMFLFPLLLVPGGLVALEMYFGSLERASTDASVESSERATLPISADPAFVEWIRADDRLHAAEGSVPLEGEVRDGDVLAELRFEDPGWSVRYRIDLARSRMARDRIHEVLRRERVERVDAALASHGLALTLEDALQLEVVDHASEAHRGGDRLGALLPGLLLFTLLIAAIYTALDVVSGEKERGTVETLLVSAVDRRIVIAAKGLVTTGAAVIAGWVGLGALALMGRSGLVALPIVLGAEGQAAMTAGPLAWIGFAVVLLSVQTAGLSLVVAAWAPDYRTGSMMSGPLLLLLLLPSGVSGMPGIQLSIGLALVPIANVSLGCRDLLAGDLSLGLGALTLFATAAHGTLALAAAWWLMSREEALLPSADTSGRRAQGFYGRDAAATFAVALLLLWFFGQLAQGIDLVWGMVFTQVMLMAGFAVIAVGYLGLPIADTMSLRRPTALDLGLAVPAGLSLPFVGQFVMKAQDPVIPMPSILMEGMAALLTPDRPLWVPLLVFAVLPGLCEELLFRGALLGMLRRSLSPTLRVLVVAIGFGLVHLMLPRFFPTATIGLVLGFVVLRTGSLWPAMLMHALNNGALLWVARTWPETEPPGWAMLIGGCAGCCAWVAAMGRGRSTPVS